MLSCFCAMFEPFKGRECECTDLSKKSVSKVSEKSKVEKLKDSVASSLPKESKGDVVMPKPNMMTTLCCSFTEYPPMK